MRYSFTCALIGTLFFLGGLTEATSTTDSSYTCSPTSPCSTGCCSKSGVCGLGPTFCGAGNCTSNCDQKSECDPGWGSQWSSAEKCPLNVCCSKYGFCGTTSDFCGNATVKSPSCSGDSSKNRIIGYYEGWSSSRPCDGLYPEDLAIRDYTHLNYAFAYVNPKTFEVAPMASTDMDLWPRFTALKAKSPDLQTWITIGGWSMNDADQPTAATFSTLVGSQSAQKAFFQSLLKFLATYGFDGVDIDWEYPVAPERSGRPEDFANYVTFLRNLRDAFGSAGHNYGLSITLPSSYWYMQNFDILAIEPLVDWFNVMTYDLHGTWDANDPYIGPYVYAHTNLTEINWAMELLWRNSIEPAKVSMGLGFYGRSFTLSDAACTAPGCRFASGGIPGPCTRSSGTLSWAEIQDVLQHQNASVTFDSVAAVKQAVWNETQWVSYDDEETLKLKVDYANSKCIGGTMVWAASLDDKKGYAGDALSVANGHQAQSLSSVATVKSALTQCVWGECAEPKNLACPLGTAPAGVAGQPNRGSVAIWSGCPKGQQRNFCCPQQNVPTCQWVGSAPWCAHATCNANQVAVASSIDGGGHSCSTNHKNLCCDRVDTVLDWSECRWSGSAPHCTALSGNLGQASCPSTMTAITADKDGAGGEQPCGAFLGYKSFCCADPSPFKNCGWYDGDTSYPYWPPLQKFRQVPIGDHHCSGSCPIGKTPVATDGSTCLGGTKAYFCCDNPVQATNPLPPTNQQLCLVPASLYEASYTPDPDDPTFEDIEDLSGENDCFMPGVRNSGYSYDVDHDEFRVRDVEFSFGSEFNSSHDLAGLDKRAVGRPRPQRLCKNMPGARRNFVKTVFDSVAYADVPALITGLGQSYFYGNGPDCSTGAVATIGKASEPPSWVKPVAEHVFEIQGFTRAIQAMLDNIGPGAVKIAETRLPWKHVFDAPSALWYQQVPSSLYAQANGLPWNQLWMSLAGTTTAVSNLLVLDSRTNGMKALIWKAQTNLIGEKNWGRMNHIQRVGALQTIKNAFDYMNSRDAQAAYAATFTSMMKVAAAFEQALTDIGINYPVRDSLAKFTRAQFNFMVEHANNFLSQSDYIQSEIDWWASPAALDKYDKLVASSILLSLNTLKKTQDAWLKIGTAWQS